MTDLIVRARLFLARHRQTVLLLIATRLNGLTDGTREDERTVQEAWGQILGQTVIALSAPPLEEALTKNHHRN